MGADGTGHQNTADILAGCSATNIAAYLCDTLTLGGYSNWFLPSKDELNKLYENIGQGNALGLGNVGGFAINYYWSSTEKLNNNIISGDSHQIKSDPKGLFFLIVESISAMLETVFSASQKQ